MFSHNPNLYHNVEMVLNEEDCNLGNERRNADIGGDRLRWATNTEINGRQFNEEVSGFNHCYANSTLDTALWVR